jgi:glycolate oxidase FAD binding subunit
VLLDGVFLDGVPFNGLLFNGVLLMVVDRRGVADALSGAVGGVVRAAGPDDVIGGVAARWVATPPDTAAVAALLAATSALGLAVVARGAGTTLSWGPPPHRVDVIVETTALAGIVEHVAGDLVVVVRAGTRIADLQAALGRCGQRLALDGDIGPATVGGRLAEGTSGPGRLLHGTLRDLLIGATVVRADGVVAHTGGKVVKNVAGFDLGKLLHGSRGTLGIVTEAVFRLHPVPAARRWILAETPSPGASVQRVLRAQGVPVALEVDRPPDGPAAVAVMLEGPAATIDARAAAMAGVVGPDAPVIDEPPPWWGARPEPGGILLRLTTEIAGLDALLAAVAATGLPVHVRGSAGTGSLLAGLPTAVGAAALGALVTGLRRDAGKWGGGVIVVDGPLDLLAGIDRWGPVPGLALMERLKDRFDPGRLLAPGRFVGNI